MVMHTMLPLRLLFAGMLVICLSLAADLRAEAPFSEPAAGDRKAEMPPQQNAEPAAPASRQGPGIIQWAWTSLTDEASITASVGILQAAMTVKRNSDGASATLVQRDENAFFLRYSTKTSFFKDSNFGYTVMVNYVHFTMTRQETGFREYTDLNTEINGQMIYAVPTLYYQWGEHRYDGTFIRLGIGIGVGAATYSGTVRFTNSANPDEVVHTANWSYALHLATSNFIEARWKHFGVSVSYAAPRIYGDVYDVRVSDFSVQLGYTYYF